MVSPTKRRKSRELCLQAMFQQEFLKHSNLTENLETFKTNFDISQDVWQYAESILLGFQQNKSEIDDKIQSVASHWDIDRMALVDLNIMRIASYELIYLSNEVPAKVVINEALEIAKKYGSTDSFSFINGVLDQILSSKT